MGDPKAFLNIPRQEAGYRPVNERIADYSQVEQTLNTKSRKLQASRCRDCGLLAIFRNLRDVFVLPFARNRVC